MAVRSSKRDRATAAEALHRKALGANWDDGIPRLAKIVAHPSCDLGTGLAVYWMGAPGFDQQYKSKRSVPSWRLETFAFVRELERRLVKRDFKTAAILFNPRFDRTTIDKKGYDWTAEYSDVEVVRRIPEVLKEPRCTDPAWERRSQQPRTSRARRLT